VSLVPRQGGDTDGETLPLADARLDQLEVAVDIDRPRLVTQHGCAHRLGAQFRGGDPKGDSEQCCGHETAEARPRAGEMQCQRRDGRHHCDQRQRLGGQREVERDPAAEQHGQPQEPALLLGLELLREGGAEPARSRARRCPVAGVKRPGPGSAHLHHGRAPLVPRQSIRKYGCLMKSVEHTERVQCKLNSREPV
jgi:hypothetical protein